jgi:hypothetical protein
MKNEPDLSELWPAIREGGNAALRPNLASRVFARMAAAREELTTQTTILVGLGTAMACLMLTLALNLWSEQRAREEALAQWSVISTENAALEQDSSL